MPNDDTKLPSRQFGLDPLRNGMLGPKSFAAIEAGRIGMLNAIGQTAERQAEFRAQIENAAKANCAGLANLQARVESDRAAMQRVSEGAVRIGLAAGPSAAEIAQINKMATELGRSPLRNPPRIGPALDGWTPPKIGAILPPEPLIRYVEPPAIEYHSPHISNLDERVEALASEVQALKAENQALAARCTAAEGRYEALERDHLELRTRRRAEFLDASQEHNPKPPVNESPFPDPK